MTSWIWQSVCWISAAQSCPESVRGEALVGRRSGLSRCSSSFSHGPTPVAIAVEEGLEYLSSPMLPSEFHGISLAGCLARLLSVAVLALAAAGCGQSETVSEPQRLNVLLLCIDDLRPELGCYGVEGMVTPNIDRLAEDGVSFSRAYCQVATCGPSRVALLTGLRPATTGAIRQYSDYRELIPDLVSLPQLFWEAGWQTRALGKIHHGSGALDDPRSWSEGCWRPDRWQRYYALPESRSRVEKAQEEWTRKDAVARVITCEAPDVPASELPDGMIADEAIDFLLGSHEAPFFLAVGFLKPHLPFVAPKRFWDLYPESDVSLTDAPEFPAGSPEFASNSSSELLAFQDVRESGLGEDVQRTLIRGYKACVSHVDAQVGRVLAALDEAGLRESTVVVLWGDHGWHLGDQGLWGKHTNFERAIRTPLIVSVPNLGVLGGTAEGLVESVDLYPTLAELCGLAAPSDLEGVSLVPLLKDPGLDWKQAAFSEYFRTLPELGRVSGHSMRTDRYHFIEWTFSESGEVIHELYDLGEDEAERINLAGDPSHSDLVGELAERLRAGWRAALPMVEPQSKNEYSDSLQPNTETD